MRYWVAQFTQQTKQAFIRYPIEIFLMFISIVPLFAWSSFMQIINENEVYYQLYPIVLMLVHLTYGKKYYALSLFIPILTILSALYFDWFDLFYEPRYWAILLSVAILFICKNFQGNNRTFINQVAVHTFKLIFSALLTFFLMLSLNVLVHIIELLFKIHFVSEYHIVIRISILSICWIFPFIYFSLSQSQENKEIQLNNLFANLLNNVLSSILLVYCIIIYTYAVKILFNLKMPEGIIANVALPYLCLSILLLAGQNLFKSSKWKRFYQYLPGLNILPLLMLCYATTVRIQHYGLTESRVYLVFAIGVLFLSYLILLFLSERQYRIIAGLLFVTPLISTFLIDAKQISVENQLQRFDHLASELSLLDENNKINLKRLKELRIIRGEKIDEDNLDQFNDSVNYLQYHLNQQAELSFREKYGLPKNNKESIYSLLRIEEMRDSYSSSSNYSFSLNTLHNQLDIKPYNQYLILNHMVMNLPKLCHPEIGCPKEIGERIYTNGMIESLVDLNDTNENIQRDFILQINNYAIETSIEDQISAKETMAKLEMPLVEWNLDELIRQLFAEHHLDIHKIYSEEELEQAFGDIKFYFEQDSYLLLFNSLSIHYVNKDNYQGYVFKEMNINGILMK